MIIYDTPGRTTLSIGVSGALSEFNGFLIDVCAASQKEYHRRFGSSLAGVISPFALETFYSLGKLFG
jgi:hypothetical protein